nr:hypothetical protein [Bacillus thuringiensis]
MTEALSIEELNTFLPLASLESLSDEEQKLRLQYWKEHFTGKEILEGLGTYIKKLYDLYKKHDVSILSKQRKTTTLQEKESGKIFVDDFDSVYQIWLISPSSSFSNAIKK